MEIEIPRGIEIRNKRRKKGMIKRKNLGDN
jgi:hypothetical protein